MAATSPTFEVNDLGYQNRTDRRDVAGGLTYQENQPGSFLRNWSLNSTLRFEHNYDWERILGVGNLQFNFRTLEFWGGALGLTRYFKANDDRNTRGGPLLERPAFTSGFFHVGSDSRKSLSLFTTINGLRGKYGPLYYTPVEMTGLYWHFVDIVWIFLFPLLYIAK